MEDWTEENLVKLSVKELKSLARKSNVNPNSKKAELVKALLTNVKDVADHFENGGTRKDNADHYENGRGQTSRRITRSRVSIWQASDETSDPLKESKAKFKNEEVNLNSGLKDSADDKRIKRKREKVDNTDTYDTSAMFPLVSSIQLASKPPVKITNKDDKQDESAPVTSKRSKREKIQNKNIENVLSSNNIGVPCLTAESNEQKDCDLNTFIEKEKRGASKDVNRKSEERKQIVKELANKEHLHPLRQLNEKLIINQSCNETEKGNQQDLVAEYNLSSEKPKQGKKRKNKSPIKNKISIENTAIQHKTFATSDVVANTHGPSKIRRKRGNEENEVQSINNMTQDIENSSVKESNEITDQSPKTSDSKTAQMKKLSASKKTKLNDSKKRKIRSGSLPKNSNRISETDQKKINVSSSSEVAEDAESSKLTELVETSSNNLSNSLKSSRQSGPLPSFQNEPTVVNDNKNSSLRKGATKNHNSSNGNPLEDRDVSAVHGETGQKSVQGPIRSTTFILSDSDVTGEPEEMPVPTRNATFILSDSDGKSPQRRSLRFTPGPALETKATSSQNADTHGNSIGHRIMQASMKRGDEKSLKKQQGSALKKTVKTMTPGSVCKKRPASKIPDFKKIHEQLFKNMESLSEHKKRQQDRARGLLQTPTVPRCALLSPRPTNTGNTERSAQRKVQDTKARTSVAPSPLAVKLKTPVASRTPAPVPAASSVNRFGFRKPLKKEEATIIIGKKLPSVNLGKIREQNKDLLKGVRMNKRFMLQMQMRQMKKDEVR